MTDSKTYSIQGADVIITVSVYPQTVTVHITVDTNKLDEALPAHSPHSLLGNYLVIPPYKTAQTYWWAKTHYQVTVKEISQAQRIIKKHLALIDDYIYQAVVKRKSRMSEIKNVF